MRADFVSGLSHVPTAGRLPLGGRTLRARAAAVEPRRAESPGALTLALLKSVCVYLSPLHFIIVQESARQFLQNKKVF